MTVEGDRGLVEYWERVGPLLDDVRRRELRNFDHRARWRAIDALLALGWEHRTTRTTSGLVELQRLFRRAGR